MRGNSLTEKGNNSYINIYIYKIHLKNNVDFFDREGTYYIYKGHTINKGNFLN